MTSTTILLTGANGFIGQALAQQLAHLDDVTLRLASRSKNNLIMNSKHTVLSSMEMSSSTNWDMALDGCDIVIHTAARVHVMKETIDDPLAAFRAINVAATLHLAKKAAQKGIKRFIFISSIKVNGESTHLNQPFTAEDTPHPADFYAISKYEAELALQQLSTETQMEVVIIRPPLVYGPGVQGNFKRMIHWLKKGLPLPLGAIQNKRSFVSLDNLISLVVLCLHHPRAGNQVFLVSDGEDISTTVLLKKMGHVMDKSIYLIPIHQRLLYLLAILSNKKSIYERLCGSLQLDITKTCEMLNWTPRVSMDEALQTMVH